MRVPVLVACLALARSGVPALEAPVLVADNACVAEGAASEGAALIQQTRVVQRRSVLHSLVKADREQGDREEVREEVSSGALHEDIATSRASASLTLIVGQQELQLLWTVSLVEAIVTCFVGLGLLQPQRKSALPLQLWPAAPHLFQALSVANIVMGLVVEAFFIALSWGVATASEGGVSIQGLVAWPRLAQNAASMGMLLGMLSTCCVNRWRSFAWRRACALLAPLASAVKYTALAYALLSRAERVDVIIVAMRVAAGFAISSSLLLSAIARESSAGGSGRFAVDCLAVVGGLLIGPAVAAAWVSTPHVVASSDDRRLLAPAILGMCFASLANALLAFLASVSAPQKGEEDPPTAGVLSGWQESCARPTNESSRRPGFALLMLCACIFVETSSCLICEIRHS